MFESSCGGGRICVIAFLPHILDSGKAGREAYVSQLQAIAQKFKAKRFTYLWSEGTAQPELESVLELGFGYPALVAVNVDKKVFSTLRGAYNDAGIREYLADMSRGSPLPPLPHIQTVESWDGEEAPVVEEEFSLEDLMS